MTSSAGLRGRAWFHGDSTHVLSPMDGGWCLLLACDEDNQASPSREWSGMSFLGLFFDLWTRLAQGALDRFIGPEPHRPQQGFSFVE